MGCARSRNRSCLPDLPEQCLNSALEDPAGKGLEAIRPIRDEIKTCMEALITEIGAAAS